MAGWHAGTRFRRKKCAHARRLPGLWTARFRFAHKLGPRTRLERWHGATASWTAAVLCRFSWHAPAGNAPGDWRNPKPGADLEFGAPVHRKPPVSPGQTARKGFARVKGIGFTSRAGSHETYRLPAMPAL